MGKKPENKYTFNEANYIQWLHDIKPHWTEEQILYSAGDHYGKDFLSDYLEEQEKEKEKKDKKPKKEKPEENKSSGKKG